MNIRLKENFRRSLYGIQPDRLLFLLVGFVFLFQSPVSGQFKFRETPNRQDPQALDERSGDAIWMRFQQGRAIGEFQMIGQLVYRPRRAEQISYAISIEGDWQFREQTTSIQLRDQSGGETFATLKTTSEGEFFVLDNSQESLEDEEDHWRPYGSLLESERLWGDLPFNYFDMAMPYLSWQRRLYAGPDRFLGRPAHAFRLINPDENASIAEVEVLIDEDYAAMLSVKLYNREGELLERLRVGGFQQFGDYWSFSELIWEKREARESVKLIVDNLVVGER